MIVIVLCICVRFSVGHCLYFFVHSTVVLVFHPLFLLLFSLSLSCSLFLLVLPFIWFSLIFVFFFTPMFGLCSLDERTYKRFVEKIQREHKL